MPCAGEMVEIAGGSLIIGIVGRLQFKVNAVRIDDFLRAADEVDDDDAVVLGAVSFCVVIFDVTAFCNFFFCLIYLLDGFFCAVVAFSTPRLDHLLNIQCCNARRNELN